MFTMFLNHPIKFNIIFTVCTFSAVNAYGLSASNPPSSSQSVSSSASGSSTSYSGVGTSSASNSVSAESSSGLESAFPPLLDPTAERFAHSLAQVLLASPVLGPNFVITDPYPLVKKISKIILERDNILDPSLVEQTAETARAVGLITKELHFNTLAHVLAKLLYLKNRLIPETILSYPRIILGYVEDYAIKNGIVDIESVMKAMGIGIINFITNDGINTVPNVKLAFRIYMHELKALSSGMET